MTTSITYASTRGEVWRFYWRLWRARLWKVHVTIFVVVAVIAYALLSAGDRSGVVAVLKVGIAGSILPIFLTLYPLMRFKPQVRRITLNEQGISTSIGARTGEIPWNDVVAVTAIANTLVIQRSNLNALVVPDRAFASPVDRTNFEAFVRMHVHTNES